ncbi:MAG: endonuclease III [Gemmatimonadaceae bacterium]
MTARTPAGTGATRKSTNTDAAGRAPAAASKGSKTARTTKAARKTASTNAPLAPLASPAVIYERLLAAHPDAHCELDFQDPYQLLVATILSAQCTDRRVNMVTPALFAAYPDATALAAARQEDVEELVRSTGFFHSKAKNLIGMATGLADLHGGQVPADMEALVRLPGVGRKTANVILGNAFHEAHGVVVDTHVQRVAGRLGLVHGGDPVKIEQELMREFPREQWTMLAHLLIFHGRRVCDARRPRCEECTLRDICPSAPIFLVRG